MKQILSAVFRPRWGGFDFLDAVFLIVVAVLLAATVSHFIGPIR